MTNVVKIEPGSIAEELGIKPGDLLVGINGQVIKDVLDYRYLVQDEELDLLIEEADGEQVLYEIEKDLHEDLGLVFEDGLMDAPRGCANRCIFCFIEQLPPNMRSTLYFKDDDFRLSFLQGNYVTLSNMSSNDLDRLVFYHLSPINISVHTTDPHLRRFMLNNKHAGDILKTLTRLQEANIDMNFQIVLCKSVNDGAVLDKSIEELSKFIPHAKSLSVVPAGLTRFRDELGLFNIADFDKADARRILAQIKSWQQKIKKRHNTKFVFAADEFYIKAGAGIPSYPHYENFPQIENGVGLIAMLSKEFDDALAQTKAGRIFAKKEISIATGMAAAGFINELARKVEERFPALHINVYPVPNIFFGERVTVAGLLTGQDICAKLQNKQLGDCLLIPEVMLRHGETVLLDGLTLAEMEKILNVPIKAVRNDGRHFINAIVNP